MLLFNDAAMQELAVSMMFCFEIHLIEQGHNKLFKCDSKDIYDATKYSYIK